MRGPFVGNAIRLAYAKRRSRTTVAEYRVQGVGVIGAARHDGNTRDEHRFVFMPQRGFHPHGIAIFGIELGVTQVLQLQVGNWAVPMSSAPVDAALFNPPHDCVHLVNPALNSDGFKFLSPIQICQLTSRALRVDYPVCDLGSQIHIDIWGPCTSVSAWGEVLLPTRTVSSRRK